MFFNSFFFLPGMKLRVFSCFIVFVLLLSACRTTKFVPDGDFLLNKVKIVNDAKDIQQSDLKEYLRQTPNSSIFGLFRLQLGVYNLAGKDTTRKINKALKRVGDEPVIYNSALTAISVQQLQQFVQNKGYMHAKVQSNVSTKGQKSVVEYTIKSNKPYTLRKYNITLNQPELIEIATDTSRTLIQPNMLFDVDVFDAERERISTRFRQLGYYNFNKELLVYTADSVLKSQQVDMNLELRSYPNRSEDSIYAVVFKKFTIRKVIFYTNTDVNVSADLVNQEGLDTVQFRDFILVTPRERIIKLDALVQNTYINPNTFYSDNAVERTYAALNSLGPIKYVNISFKENKGDSLDCYIIVVPGKTVSLSTELEATYTNGYWGVAGNVNVTHRNLFKGAETLSVQARIAYEWQAGVWAQEWGGQVGLKFPRFLLPFASYDFKRNIHANTEFTTAFSYQNRPGEFITKSVGAGIKYLWNERQYRHVFEFIDLSYVYFPWISSDFRDSYLTTGIFNDYNYQDHFIMRMGYSGSYTNFSTSRPLRNFSTMRYSIETAGNFLYGMNKVLGTKPSADGSYKLFKIRYSQYFKSEYNITHHQIFDKYNRFVYHAGVGFGIPYGNADAIPYERRFFSGGANSVRGWSESTLGPGVYQRIDARRRDYNQTGDVKLGLNMEYRSKLVGMLEGALFLDAGNIWTIKNYETQQGGVFKLDTFMSQIAMSYGLGIRLDFSFFIARVDLGVKLYNPVLERKDQWRVNPAWSDLALHLAIGYPF